MGRKCYYGQRKIRLIVFFILLNIKHEEIIIKI